MSASESNGYGSAHDPLCCIGEGKFDGYCQCPLIARVREDERAAALREAVEAVIRLCAHTKYEGCAPCPHDEAVTAIKALRKEQK